MRAASLSRPLALAGLVAAALGLSFHSTSRMEGAERGPAWERPDPARRLDAEEMRMLVDLGDVLIDRDAEPFRRREAARKLGEVVAHRSAIPALVAVVRDPQSPPQVRQGCVISLSWIADRRVIELLIDAVGDPHVNVSTEAEKKLRALTGRGLEDFEGAEREARVQQWRDWWRANKDDAAIQWDRALFYH